MSKKPLIDCVIIYGGNFILNVTTETKGETKTNIKCFEIIFKSRSRFLTGRDRPIVGAHDLLFFINQGFINLDYKDQDIGDNKGIGNMPQLFKQFDVCDNILKVGFSSEDRKLKN